jgi:hypothetical protein
VPFRQQRLEARHLLLLLLLLPLPVVVRPLLLFPPSFLQVQTSQKPRPDDRKPLRPPPNDGWREFFSFTSDNPVLTRPL